MRRVPGVFAACGFLSVFFGTAGNRCVIGKYNQDVMPTNRPTSPARWPRIFIVVAFLCVWSFPYGADCVNYTFSPHGCPELHPWYYLPVGVLAASLALSLMSLAKPDATVGMKFGMVTFGYAISLAVRAVLDPVIHHALHEQARLDVGLAVVLLMLAPTWRSWHGAALSLASGGLILNHWFS